MRNSRINENAWRLTCLRQLVIGQQQQNKILEQLCQQNAAMQQQRANELQQWKSANPELARSCREAAETLSRVQTQFLDNYDR